MSSILKIARQTRRALFGVSGIADDLKAQWDQAISNFQASRAQLDFAESALYDVQALASDEADAAEWQRQYDRVNAQMSTMDAMAGAVSTVAAWWADAKNWIGLSGAQKRDGLAGNLGIALPALPITLIAIVGAAAAAAAIYAAVSKFVDYLRLKENYRHDEQVLAAANDARQQVLDAGGTLEQADGVAHDLITEANDIATARAKQESGVSFGASLERVAIWGAVIAGIVFLAPALMKGRR